MADNPPKKIITRPGSYPEIEGRYTSYPTMPPAPAPGAAAGEVGMLRVQDLNTILEVNQKALTIYLEVEKQNEDILEVLKESKEIIDTLPKMSEMLTKIAEKQVLTDKNRDEDKKLWEEMKKKMEELDKNFFRLILVLGSTGIGTILNLVQSYLSTK